jgi:hypothetical protein
MSSALPSRFPNPLPRTGPETWCFAVQAEASPGLMPRVLELFAKRNLVPGRWHSALTPGSTELSMDIQVAQIDGELPEVRATRASKEKRFSQRSRKG